MARVFKYLRANIDPRVDGFEHQLNQFGNDGWELVSCTEKIEKNTVVIFDCVFKQEGIRNDRQETNNE
jgi:hypothetical protein